MNTISFKSQDIFSVKLMVSLCYLYPKVYTSYKLPNVNNIELVYEIQCYARTFILNRLYLYAELTEIYSK